MNYNDRDYDGTEYDDGEGYSDEYESRYDFCKTPKEDKLEHPDFAIEQVHNRYQLWLINPVTLEKKESFGFYSKFWMATREAIKMQGYSDAEAF
jgi:hypothetical protein